MASFTAGPAGVHAQLEEHEADLLRQLIDEMRTLLEADIPRSDDVLGRLFPPAYEDADQQIAYAQLVEDELRRAKLEALRAVREIVDTPAGGDRSMTDEETRAWLTLLTDLRLAIGTRLNVTEEKMATELDPSSPEAAAYSVLHWLGWLQEQLLEAVDPYYRNDSHDDIDREG